jgi:hypothetical protein
VKSKEEKERPQWILISFLQTCKVFIIACVLLLLQKLLKIRGEKREWLRKRNIGLRKCSIYIEWDFTHPQKRMKFYYFQVNEWNWRTSS